MYIINPKPDDIVVLYKLSKQVYSEIEGTAKLISFREKGDTFYMDNEAFPTNDESDADDRVYLSKKYNDIDKAFGDSLFNPAVRSYHRKMKSLCTGVLDNDGYNKMYKITEEFRETYTGYKSKIHAFFNTPVHILVRYFEQKYISDWRPTLFRLERWLVEIQPEDKFGSPFRTYRWIPVLVRRCVKDNVKRNKGKSIGALTTYNGGKRYHIDIQNDIFELEDFILKRKRRVITRKRFKDRESFKEMIKLSKIGCEESNEDELIDNPGPCDRI